MYPAPASGFARTLVCTFPLSFAYFGTAYCQIQICRQQRNQVIVRLVPRCRMVDLAGGTLGCRSFLFVQSGARFDASAPRMFDINARQFRV
jgi:hypothetical protein